MIILSKNDVKKVNEALALLDSMVLGNDYHSDKSNYVNNEARNLLRYRPLLCRIFGHMIIYDDNNIAGKHHCMRKNCFHNGMAIIWPRE